ncbi:MAG: YraN family protein [Hyphomicrobiaceae bacterium]|nr:YraN family protein [Hyphomicrobiaceae bacterium]
MTADAGKHKTERQARYRRGHVSEYLAAAFLVAKGYRILARRFQSPAGEVDLVACRGKRLAFIEVKRRPTLEACEASIGNAQRQRIRRAAECWLARHARHRQHDICFDAIFLAAGKWPRHLPNSL